ncbi:MAG: LTA synthase family protein, partial [Cytophagaceae bacterium]|nr:LTA synthase family protein [Cytophagaceae bacterium]
FSFPALKRIRPMSMVPARTYSGFPYTLKQHGYTNLFFSPHSGIFDNMNIFLPDNFIDRLYTSDEYPQDKILGPFGVPDDYMFTYALNEINKLDSSKNFFATILTASNHSPYTLPAYYKSAFEDASKSGVSYADWSIKQFLNQVKHQKWFGNTIFIFVADHGLVVGENAYDLALSYNHIPIIIYAPEILGAPKMIDNMAGQIDIFPTVMEILNASYINNTLGVDAINYKRDYIYFSADSKMGCINDEWLFVYRYSGGESLYKYKTGSTEDYAEKNPEVLSKLKDYAFSQTQVAQWMFVNNKTSVPKKF